MFCICTGLAGDYYFKDIIEENEADGVDVVTKRGIRRSFDALLELLQMCSTITFDVDGKEPTEAMKVKISSLRTRSIRLLVLVEQHAPATFFAQYMHELVHVVDSTARWGSARNFWSFFSER